MMIIQSSGIWSLFYSKKNCWNKNINSNHMKMFVTLSVSCYICFVFCFF